MQAVNPIAHIKNDFKSKFGIPRQSGMVEIESTIVFEPQYRNPDALRGLEEFSHLWLIWGFSKAKIDSWTPTVRPPRLGGNTHVGVFATRSPFRPNSLGLSSVELVGIEQTKALGCIVKVRGADLMDNTPIYDIKPYLPFTDSHQNAKAGFTESLTEKRLCVRFLQSANLSEAEMTALRQVLEADPRPSYHNDKERIYGLTFGKYEVKFSVDESTVTVHAVSPSLQE